jgi:hypothetical protein
MIAPIRSFQIMALLDQLLSIFRKNRGANAGEGVEIAPGIVVNHPKNYQPACFPKSHTVSGFEFTQKTSDEFLVTLPYPNPHFVEQELVFRLSSTQTIEERHLRLLGEIRDHLDSLMERFVEEVTKYEDLDDPSQIKDHASNLEIVYEDLGEDEEGLEEWHVAVGWGFKSIFMEMKGLEVTDVWAGS